MKTEKDAALLLSQAQRASTYSEAQRLVSEAESIRTDLALHHAAAREVDLAAAQQHVAQALQPVAVYDRTTKDSDWIADMAPAVADESRIHAEATLWYSNIADVVKEHIDEFKIQAEGKSRKIASPYGPASTEVSRQFLTQVAELHQRDLNAGVIQITALGEGQPSPQVGEAPGSLPTDTFPSGQPYEGLPEQFTTSERAPQLQSLEENNSSGSQGSDVVGINDPGLGQADTTADEGNNDLGSSQVADIQSNLDRQAVTRKESFMDVIQCPTCGGHGKTAVARGAEARQVWAQQQKRAYSGLPQITQIVNNSDTEPEETEYPTQVAFPLVWDQNNVPQAIRETEQQLAEREQRKGASRHQAAARLAQQTYMRIMAGQDDSGWAGDMGAQGWTPGQQDGGNPGGPSNLQQPDPVYGYGGDQQQRPVKPYSDAEANDYTNNPGMNWQPGQPTQYDMGGRQQQTQGQPGPGFPNAPINNRQGAIRPDYSQDAGYGGGRPSQPSYAPAPAKTQGPQGTPIRSGQDLANLSNGQRGSLPGPFEVQHSSGGKDRGVFLVTHHGPTMVSEDPSQIHQKLHSYDSAAEKKDQAQRVVDFATNHAYGNKPTFHNDSQWSRVDRYSPDQDLH